MKKFVVLAGNIGAGKSTLVGLLSQRLGFRAFFEPVAENPFLSDFYADMGRWAFHSQVFFLTSRVRSHRALMGESVSVVQDRSLYEDALVFARNLYVQGSMSQRDWETYLDLYRSVVSLLPPPDLVVYLRASVPTLKKRIAMRGRDFEADIPDSYLSGLNDLYEDWIAGFDLSPVLSVPADRLDFVAQDADLDVIVDTVADLLRDRQRGLFPHDM